MARIRTIKPEFWTDSALVALPMEVRLFYIGLWNFADDYGVLEDDPIRLKLQILPADDVDVAGYIDALVAAGRVARATAEDGTRVLVVRHFGEHQKISHKADPRYGHPSDLLRSPPESSGGNRTPPEDSARKGTVTEHHARRDGTSFDADFSTWWEHYPRKVQKAAAFTAYKARRRDGTDHATLVAALEHYASSVAGVELRFVMHGSRFLGGKAGPWSEWVNGPPEPVAKVMPAAPEVTRAVLGRGPDALPVWELDDHGNAVAPAC